MVGLRPRLWGQIAFRLTQGCDLTRLEAEFLQHLIGMLAEPRRPGK